MNDYSLKDLNIGLSHSFDVKITEEMMAMFQKITGDSNPLHTDNHYARSRGFPDRVVYGLLTASFLSTFAGIYIPGKKSLIHSLNVNLHKPVFIGDTLSINGEVQDKDERFSCIKLKLKITNQDIVRVASGSMQIGVVDDLIN